MFIEIARLKSEYVGDKELSEAKEKLIGNFIIGLETNLEKASVSGTYETLGLGYEYVEDFANMINSVKDTDILEVANKYFNNNYVISIVTK